jgi:hypothetical protein
MKKVNIYKFLGGFNMVDSIRQNSGPSYLGTTVAVGVGAGAGYGAYKLANNTIKRCPTIDDFINEIKKLAPNNAELTQDVTASATKTYERCKSLAKGKLKPMLIGAAIIGGLYLGIKTLFGHKKTPTGGRIPEEIDTPEERIKYFHDNGGPGLIVKKNKKDK